MDGKTDMTLRRIVDAANANGRIRALKNIRNEVIDRFFRWRGRAAGQALAEELRQSGARSVCFAIAFNTPWVIDLLTAAWARHARGMKLVVIDNSSSTEASSAHRAICQERDVAYLKLPSNPEWSPNRSHGISMNWVYYNIVRPLRPELFGFIDHDCIPVRDFDLADRMAGLNIYGYRRGVSEPWSMWAGFSFFRFAARRGRGTRLQAPDRTRSRHGRR